MPVISPAPASPAKAPEMAITATIVRLTPMPAYLAALGFVPTVRTSNPNVVRLRMNHTTTHSAIIEDEPEVQRRLAARRARGGGRLSGGAAVRGTEAVVSRRITGSRELTSQRMQSTAMLLSMIVTITSWAPVRALRTPGMPPQSPPPTAPASRMIGMSDGAGHVRPAS